MDLHLSHNWAGQVIIKRLFGVEQINSSGLFVPFVQQPDFPSKAGDIGDRVGNGIADLLVFSHWSGQLKVDLQDRHCFSPGRNLMALSIHVWAA
jgi:hypothetical protein